MITIHYIPLITGTTTHTRKLPLNSDQLTGMILMASIITDSTQLTIELDNGTYADITQAHTLPNYGNHPSTYDYTVNFGQQTISYNGNDILQGAVQLCMIFGIDPGAMITNVTYHGTPGTLDFMRYFGLTSIPNFTSYPVGTVISLSMLNSILSSKLVNSLSKSLHECFPDVEAGIPVPCELYMICTDETRSNIAASLAISTHLPENIGTHPNTYYISNVCAGTAFRGQGLAKSLMICMLNNLISAGHHHFLLEVAPNNTIAYTLYISLGFQHIQTIADYYLMYLNTE